MVKLEDDMILYHGSYTKVEKIDLSKSSPNKDFGRGFYVTSSLEQAKSFARLSLNRAVLKKIVTDDERKGFVSVFKLELSDMLIQKTFEQADVEWLHFVIANRDNNCFPGLLEKYKQYNVIIGKIANDRTAATLQAYLENAYGVIGSPEADNMAIATLLPNRLENQICLRDENAVSCLKFMEYIEYGT